MKIDYESLAEMVSTSPSPPLKPDQTPKPTQMGEHCTPRAVQERIKKLRKDAKAGFDPSSPAMATPGTASPAKAAPSKVTKPRKAPAVAKGSKGKRGPKAKAEQADADDEELEEGDGVKEEETKAPARKVRCLPFTLHSVC